MRITGDYSPPGRSSRRPAWLEVDGAGGCWLHVGEERLRQGRFSDLEISPRLGDTPRVIRLALGAAFETRDNDAIDRLLARFEAQTGYRWLHWLESRWSAVALGVVVTGVLVWGFLNRGLPWVAEQVAVRLPPEVSRSVGQGALDMLDHSVFAPSRLPAARQRALQAYFQRYAHGYGEPVHVLFRSGGPIGANALALASSRIVFTDELVALAKDDRELLAVFAHELGHLHHRHLLRRVVQDSLISLLPALLLGDVSAASSLVYGIPVLLMELKYSRAFETEADRFAYCFLRANGIPPEHFAAIMYRLAAAAGAAREGGLPDYLATHPAPKVRIQRFVTGEGFACR
ncbi:MAG TPA: M48 family metallopeptidase [Methylothermaceae bacterium]|nr:M48 family metallopeptidase [Methylothermaceae bacterium]